MSKYAMSTRALCITKHVPFGMLFPVCLCFENHAMSTLLFSYNNLNNFS